MDFFLVLPVLSVTRAPPGHPLLQLRKRRKSQVEEGVGKSVMNITRLMLQPLFTSEAAINSKPLNCKSD